jgi:hypothetical protein
MQLIKIIETEINILFPDGYEILLDDSGVSMSIGEKFEFAGSHYVVKEVKHKFAIPKNQDYKTERVHQIRVVLSRELNRPTK